jgi:hypothetical protein
MKVAALMLPRVIMALLFIIHSFGSNFRTRLSSPILTRSLIGQLPPKTSRSFISLENISPNFMMQLLAGTNTVGFSGDGTPATSSQIHTGNIWVSTGGNVFIPDRSNFRIRKISSAGIIATIGGTGSTSTTGDSGSIAAVSFNIPYAIVGDTAGLALYISDQLYVWKFVFTTGIASVFAHSTSLSPGFSGDNGLATSAQLNTPKGLWLTTSGILYIADSGNHCIRKILTSNNIISTVAGSGSGTGGYSGDSGQATSATLNNPVGVFVDLNGLLYIADCDNNVIRGVIPSTNIIITFAGTGTATPFNGDNLAPISVNLNQPTDVKGDSSGNIYIADWGNCIIRMLDNSDETISTLFGNPLACGYSTGISSRSAAINGPMGIWVDTLSQIYFSDSNSIHRGITVASPTSQPSGRPSRQPTSFPSSPSSQPSSRPTRQPSSQPSRLPTAQPVSYPTSRPSIRPSSVPSNQPTTRPSGQPSNRPSVQPTSVPSKQPVLSPTGRPSGQPTGQPFSRPSSRPLAPIYKTGGVLFFPGDSVYPDQASLSQETKELLGKSFIVFGRDVRHDHDFPFELSLESTEINKEFVSFVDDSISGVKRDTFTRSTTVIGDINNDDLLDLMIGLPMESRCLVYLGNALGGIDQSRESFAIIGHLEHGGGQLGWAATPFKDVNHDTFNEIVVSAPYANIVYFIFGKAEFTADIMVHDDLLPGNIGFKIIGSAQDTNFGVSLAELHDFNKDGFQDLAITAVRPGGANVIYLLLGNSNFGNEDISIDQLIARNPTSCMRIFAPYLSNAGLSVTGIGDLNSDGYYDLAVGSIPINNAKYAKQRTYIIYGKEITSRSVLFLAQMTSTDGFMVTGGGFLVEAAGDVDGDGIADLMIISYDDWKGKGNAYLINPPSHVTRSPTFQPSSRPSSSPFSHPSSSPSSSFPSSAPSFLQTSFFPTSSTTSSSDSPHTCRPSRSPTIQPSRKPSRLPSVRPSQTSSPSLSLTLPPTVKPSAVPTAFHISPSHQPATNTFLPTIQGGGGGEGAVPRLRTRTPSVLPTVGVTVNTIEYTEIECPVAGDYQGMNDTNYKFLITAESGTVKITGRATTGARNLYVLHCPKRKNNVNDDRVDIAIQNFRISTDTISLVHLVDEKTGNILYSSMKDLSFARTKGPLTLLLCENNKLQVILSSHSSFALQEKNFLFFPDIGGDQSDNNNDQNSVLEEAQMGIALSVLILLFLSVYCVFKATNDDAREEYSLYERYLAKKNHGDIIDDHDHDDNENKDSNCVDSDKNHALSSKSSSSSSSSSSSFASSSPIPCDETEEAPQLLVHSSTSSRNVVEKKEIENEKSESFHSSSFLSLSSFSSVQSGNDTSSCRHDKEADIELGMDALKPLPAARNCSGDDEEVGDKENNNQVGHTSEKNESHIDHNSCSSVKTGLLATENNDIEDEDADDISDWESLSEDIDDCR